MDGRWFQFAHGFVWAVMPVCWADCVEIYWIPEADFIVESRCLDCGKNCSCLDEHFEWFEGRPAAPSAPFWR